MKSIFSLLLFICFLFPLSGCQRQTAPVSRTGFYFDTVIQISIYKKEALFAESLLDDCFQLAAVYESRFSKTQEGSDIWKLNQAKGKPVEVHTDTILLLQTALHYAELTHGRIDPTIAPVSSLWNFSQPKEASLPSEESLTEALSHVDYHRLKISDTTVTLEDPDAALDLGFIAKGFIADRIKEYLLTQDVDSAIINLGGNVLTIGVKPDGSPFQVGIQQPFSPTGTAALTLPANNISLVSSGIYERYFEKEGKLYHHILDTKTGYPIQNNLYAVTILSPSSVEGDALSTTCFVLGLEEGMAFIESLEEVEAVFLTSDGTIHTSSGLSLP